MTTLALHEQCSGPAPRNDLGRRAPRKPAGSGDPRTNFWRVVLAREPIDFAGTNAMYPVGASESNIVKIKITGARGSDFTAAYKEANIKVRPPSSDATWQLKSLAR
jgi:hypothetical protein